MEENKNELMMQISQYFIENIFEAHIQRASTENSKLSAYKINPILIMYLSRLLEGNYTPMGVAKALYYPRVLSTSISTMFGTQIQKMFVVLKIAVGAKAEGLDITFVDKIDGREKWCQLKSGPNNINADDVDPILRKFNSFIKRSRTNHALANIRNTDCIVGVIYGDRDDLSNHYSRIDQTYPVIIGKEFWQRLTGYEDFYNRLVKELHVAISSIDASGLLDTGIQSLAEEIAASNLFEFSEL